MPAQFQFLNYADVVSSAEGVKGQRLKNRMMGLQLDEAENVIEKRRKYEEIHKFHKDRPARIGALYAVGMIKEAQQLEKDHLQALETAYATTTAAADFLTEDTYDGHRELQISHGVPAEIWPTEWPGKEWLKKQKDQTRNAIKTFSQTRPAPGGDGVQMRDVEVNPNIDRGQPGRRAEGPWYDPRGKTRAPAGSGDDPLGNADFKRIQSIFAQNFGAKIMGYNQQTGEPYYDADDQKSKMAFDAAALTLELVRTQKLPEGQAMQRARWQIENQPGRYQNPEPGQAYPPRTPVGAMNDPLMLNNAGPQQLNILDMPPPYQQLQTVPRPRGG